MGRVFGHRGTASRGFCGGRGAALHRLCDAPGLLLGPWVVGVGPDGRPLPIWSRAAAAPPPPRATPGGSGGAFGLWLSPIPTALSKEGEGRQPPLSHARDRLITAPRVGH